MNEILDSKKEKINYHVKISLTEKGINFFNDHKRKIEKIRMADNDLVYGISFKSLSYDYLRKLIKAGFILKIEIGSPEFNTKKHDIIDLTKVIFYEFLYLKFNNLIFNSILKTEAINKWNRLNPLKIIDEKTRFNTRNLKIFLKAKEEDKNKIIRLLLNDVKIYLNNFDSPLSEDEKNIKIHTALKILNNLNDFTWFIILNSIDFNEYNIIINNLKEYLIDFLEKCKISDYLPLMLLELLGHAENIKIKKILKKHRRNANIDKIIFDKSIREKIYRKMEDKKDYIYITWKVGEREPSQDTKLKITILSKEHNFRELKDGISDKLKINLKGKNLFDFYKEIPEKELHNELGLYYLTYLNEACRELDVKFDSFINQMHGDDFPIITLSFNIK